jgi:hypothetical protein
VYSDFPISLCCSSTAGTDQQQRDTDLVLECPGDASKQDVANKGVAVSGHCHQVVVFSFNLFQYFYIRPMTLRSRQSMSSGISVKGNWMLKTT